jgi:rhodanese-related sulfurtransferase
MKSAQKLISKIRLITFVFFVAMTQTVAAQSVYVGQAGAEGKALRKYIEPLELKKLVESPVDSIWIIDVRSEKAFLNGHIPTAKSFPAANLSSRLSEIPKDKYLIVYCTVGGMAKIASKTLKKAGYKRYINWGGITRWKWDKEIQPTAK